MGAQVYSPTLRNRRGGPGGGAPANPVVDLAAFPVLTEEVGFPPSPLAKSGGTPGAAPGVSGALGLGQTAANAIADVLGWKTKPNDPKAFLGALTQSFSLAEVEGRIESKWVQRSYAVQTDLAGGISGAQASLYSRAKYLLDQSLPLLDGLSALDPDVDMEEAEADRQVVRSQMIELVNEFAYPSGPRISRVNQYFFLLLGQTLSATPPNSYSIQFDPDQIGGTLGNLRDLFGLATVVYTQNAAGQWVAGSVNDLINTIQDETDVTNYRILSDYLTSLAQSWVSNYRFFMLGTQANPAAQPFFGTQLVLISRQLQVVAEMVNELRFVLDSVFLGPAERQTMLLTFSATPPSVTLPPFPGMPQQAQQQPQISVPAPIFLEDLLLWIENLATTEGPSLIQTSGKFGVAQVVQIAVQQYATVTEVGPSPQLPPAFAAPRVSIALANLQQQLYQLLVVTGPVALAPVPTSPIPTPQSQTQL